MGYLIRGLQVAFVFAALLALFAAGPAPGWIASHYLLGLGVLVGIALLYELGLLARTIWRNWN